MIVPASFEADTWQHAAVAWLLAPEGARRAYVGYHPYAWVEANIVSLVRGTYRPSEPATVRLPPLAAQAPAVRASDGAACSAWPGLSELNRLSFEPGEIDLTEERRDALDENVAVLRQCPETCVLVRGLSVPVEEDGLRRARQRAEAVRRYYTRHGVDPHRILAEASVLDRDAMLLDGYDPSLRNLAAASTLAACPGE